MELSYLSKKRLKTLTNGKIRHHKVLSNSLKHDQFLRFFYNFFLLFQLSDRIVQWLTESLDKCKDEACRLIYLRSFKNQPQDGKSVIMPKVGYTSSCCFCVDAELAIGQCGL